MRGLINGTGFSISERYIMYDRSLAKGFILMIPNVTSLAEMLTTFLDSEFLDRGLKRYLAVEVFKPWLRRHDGFLKPDGY
jgi:hypothetical protein